MRWRLFYLRFAMRMSIESEVTWLRFLVQVMREQKAIDAMRRAHA